jgi:hypothetical protein
MAHPNTAYEDGLMWGADFGATFKGPFGDGSFGLLTEDHLSRQDGPVDNDCAWSGWDRTPADRDEFKAGWWEGFRRR